MTLQAAGNVRKDKNKVETYNNLVGQLDTNSDIMRKLEKGVENRNQRKELSDEHLNKELAALNAKKTDEKTNLASVFKTRRLLNYQGISLSMFIVKCNLNWFHY